MDSAKELLESWSIPEEIVNNFLENGITIEQFPKLKPENLKELCPQMGTRIGSQEKILELVTACAPTEANSNETVITEILEVGDPMTSNCDCEAGSSGTSTSLLISLDDIQVANFLNTSASRPRQNFPNFDLDTLLQTSAGGSSILKYYETRGFLDNTKRNQLVDIIIKHIYTYIVNYRITYEEYNVIAAKIIALFPKDSIGTYYTKPITKINSIHGRSTIARGKLVDKVRNLLYKYGDRKRQSTSELQNTLPKKTNIEDLQNMHSRDILFLNNNNEPWEEVMHKWKTTFIVRKESETQNVHDFLELVQNFVNDITSKIYQTIKNEHIDATKRITAVQEMILALPNIFKGYDTEYKRLKELNDQKHYVAPLEVTIGSSKDRLSKNNDVTMILKERKLYMTPLRQTLIFFLMLPGVLSDIINYQKMLFDESNTIGCDVIRNITQGSLWKELTANIEKDNIVIPLILYFDDFESGNALGSHAGEYKLGAVYISIGTIPPEKSSRLENIFVAQVFYSNDRVYFGNEALFNNIIEELEFLEEVGVDVALATKDMTVKFILVTLSGDNLGLHGIMGLFESFMATHFCRFCLTTKIESETQSCELNNLRMPSEYDEHVENRIGIKEKCVWNRLKYFNIYNNVTCDLMHDLTEGVHRYGMALVIQSLIDKKYFSLDRLNSRIKYFKYNTTEKNIPPPVNNQHLLNKSLTMSASEMLCLTRNFVFIVGDLVQDNDPVWNYYLILLEITNILTSHSFTLELIDYLKDLIEEHHQQYLNLFQSKLKPKHHFLIHYPTIIKKIGPPILISAFKYEAKHKELKKVCQSITSRKDLPLSVMKRCQLKQSFRYAINKGLTDNFLYGKFQFDKNHDSDNCIYVDWCELNGIRYTVNNVLLQDVIDDIPKYYIINKIIINNFTNDISFKCFFLDIVDYSAHFRAYKVIQTLLSCTIAYRDLYTNLTSVVYKLNSDSYVKVDF